MARSFSREESFSVGRILAEIDISELLRVRRQVLLTLVAVNAGLALGFAAIGSLALGACSSLSVCSAAIWSAFEQDAPTELQKIEAAEGIARVRSDI